jgi:hypothetical protein
MKYDHPGMISVVHEKHMRYYRVYKAAPALWSCIGRYYFVLDIFGAMLFVVGSIFFSIPNILVIVKARASEELLDWLLMTGVIAFTLAKGFVTSRGVYSELWDRPAKRIGWAFLWGIIMFFIGGVLFAVVLAIDLRAGSPDTERYIALPSSLCFLIGGILFTGSSICAGDLRLSTPYDMHNVNFLSGIGLFAGGLLYTVQSSCDLPGERDAETDDDPSYALSDATACSPAFFEHTGLAGGISFLVASILMLWFAVWELREHRAEGTGLHTRPDRKNRLRPHPHMPGVGGQGQETTGKMAGAKGTTAGCGTAGGAAHASKPTLLQITRITEV